MKNIPHSKPCVGQKEIAAVSRAIKSGMLSQNGEVIAFEKELCEASGQKYSSAVSSGTAGLYLALKALNIKENDLVIIPSYVCTALLHAVLFAGAKPVLADVDDRTGLINVDTVKKVLTKKAKAVIAPHLFGAVCDARSIEDLGVPVIEDCAQCFGVKHGNNLVGSQTAISVFSLYATKLIAAGEGGLVATSDSSLYKKIIRLREYDNRETFAPAFNFKLSDVHASIARAQLAQLGMFIKARRTIAAWYKKELAFVKGISLPAENVMGESVWFRYVISVKNAPKMIHELQEQGIGAARPIFKPLHRYLQLDGFKATDEMQKKSVSIPLYPDLTLADCHRIVSAIKLVQ